MKSISVTLDVEDLRPSNHFEDRSKLMAEKVLDLFNQMSIRATIFVVGDVAQKHPEIIEKAAQHGHEIGLHSHKHIPLELLNPDEFERKLTAAKTLLQGISGQKIDCIRAPTMSLTHKTRWAIPILQRVGFNYSSSVLPAKNPLYGWDGLPRHPFRWLDSVIEFPCPVTNILGFTIPYLGGAYFRLFPSVVRKMGVRRSSSEETLWTYCHPWEFDPEEKYYQLENVGRVTSRIAWIGRKGMENKMRDFLKEASSQTLGEIASKIDPSQLKIVNPDSPHSYENRT